MQIVETMCDICKSQDDVTHYAFGSGEESYDIDLCRACHEKYVDPFMALLREHGRVSVQAPVLTPPPPTSTAPSSGHRQYGSSRMVRCVICGFEGRVSALRIHALTEHNVGASVAMGNPVAATCPDCGFKTSHTKGLPMHRRYSHGVPFAYRTKKQSSAQAAEQHDVTR